MDLNIIILYEDDDLIVIDKPSGVTVNRSNTTGESLTVQDWAEKYLGVHPPKTEDNTTHKTSETDYLHESYFKRSFLERGGIVHRIDKETSGILLIAKSWESFKNIQEQFKERIIEKSYIALVHGILVPPEGQISIPVDRLPWNRQRFGIVAGGRASTTLYKTLKTFIWKESNSERVSLLELHPLTGRTHQIRVHMKYLNRPIVADELYAGRKTSRNDRKYLKRLFLHATNITFQHPRTGRPVSFVSKLPDDLEKFMHDNLVLIEKEKDG